VLTVNGDFENMEELAIGEFEKLPKERESTLFEKRVRQFFALNKGLTLSEQILDIGKKDDGSPLRHKFDMVSEDGTIVGECKSYKWTKSGNYPSGKISTANEALFYLSRVNAKEKFLVLKDDVSRRGKSLPEVYVSRSSGLMDDVEIYKYIYHSDGEKDELVKIRSKGKVWYHKLVAEDLLDFSKKKTGKTRLAKIDEEISSYLERLIEAFKAIKAE